MIRKYIRCKKERNKDTNKQTNKSAKKKEMIRKYRGKEEKKQKQKKRKPLKSDKPIKGQRLEIQSNDTQFERGFVRLGKVGCGGRQNKRDKIFKSKIIDTEL